MYGAGKVNAGRKCKPTCQDRAESVLQLVSVLKLRKLERRSGLKFITELFGILIQLFLVEESLDYDLELFFKS